MTSARDNRGFTLVELLVVISLFTLVVFILFAIVDSITTMSAKASDEASASRDLSYQVEILSKMIMQGKVLYADDNNLYVKTSASSGTYINNLYVDTVTSGGVTTGRLVHRRWTVNTAGTGPVSGSLRTWVVSETNGNLLTQPVTNLFRYYRDDIDSNVLTTADRSSAPFNDLSAYAGTLPGAYNRGSIYRIRLHVVTSQGSGALMKRDHRDIWVRMFEK